MTNEPSLVLLMSSMGWTRGRESATLLRVFLRQNLSDQSAVVAKIRPKPVQNLFDVSLAILWLLSLTQSLENHGAILE